MTINIVFSQDVTPITTFTGPITGQADLQRMIAKIRDINLPMISVNQVGSLQENQHKLNTS